MTIKVHKFGGSSLKSYAGLQQCVNVIQFFAEKESTWAVVSALYGVTDRLQTCINKAVRQEDISDELEAIKAPHREYLKKIAELGGDVQAWQEKMQRYLHRLEQRLQGVSLLSECPDRIQAQILGTGELLSAVLFAALLAARECQPCLLSRDQGLIAKGDYLNAVVDIEASRAQLQSYCEQPPQVLVMPGFVARNQQGQRVTLGRNGTDYSAACLAVVCNAQRCMIWKDVKGIYTANPVIAPDARFLPKVSYAEALELSYFGAKVISAKAIGPLQAHGMPCEIRHFEYHDQPGTLISEETDPDIKGLSHLDGMAMVSVSGPGLRGQVGAAERVFDTLARQGISIVLIVQSSSEYSISLAIHEAQAGQAVSALEAAFHYERLHGQVDEIQVLPSRAIVSLVGDGLWHRKGIAAQLFTAVSAAGVNIEAIAQGPSERAITLVVKSSDAEPALRACHDAFFAREQHLDLILLGCGNVGKVLLEQFDKQQAYLSEQHIKVRVRAIANSRQWIAGKRAIDLAKWQEELAEQSEDYQWSDLVALKNTMGLVNATVVDCTASKAVASRYPELIRTGFNIVAANKHANTDSQAFYQELRELARNHCRKFVYETNVAAGLPVMETLQFLIHSGDELKSFGGILSGTMSLIFGLLEDGHSFSQAVAIAREKGFTEPDPREDLNGSDVARKLLIVAREVGMKLEMEDVQVEPLVPADYGAGQGPESLTFEDMNAVFEERVKAAQAENKTLRYVAGIKDGRCSVAIEAVGLEHPLYAIRDGENALALFTRYYQPIPMVLRGYGAGAEVTAAGVFGDVLRTLWKPLGG